MMKKNVKVGISWGKKLLTGLEKRKKRKINKAHGMVEADTGEV